MSLKGKTRFTTGASRGIGLAIARRAAADGADVVIATAALQLIPGVDLNLCRKPEILADAAYLIFTGPSSNSGNFYIDDELLAAHGVKDLEKYSVKPGTKNFIPDFFLD